MDYCGQRPTEAQVKDIATVRQYLTALSEEQKKDFSPWIDRLTDVRSHTHAIQTLPHTHLDRASRVRRGIECSVRAS